MSNVQANQSTTKASPKLPTKAVLDAPASSPSSPVVISDQPSYANAREFLKGKEVTFFAPADHWFSRIYCDLKRDDTFGRFNCTLLDVILDEVTGAPLNAIIQYRDRGARIWGSRDLINLQGITISTSYQLPSNKEDDDASAAEYETKH
jgi:hypothetical protein